MTTIVGEVIDGGGGGATGATGPQGSQGTQGSQGSIGVTGNDGARGSQGTQGSPGTQGSIGVTGPQGTQGTQGSIGVTGATGPTGNQGTQGTQGSLGPTGVTGAQGTQGSPGTQGSIGATGATGPMGNAFKWTFSGPTSATAPTGGNVRLNATGFSNTTQIYVSEINADGTTVDVWLSNLATSTNANTAIMYISKASDPTVFAVYKVQSLVDNGSWDQVNVTYLNSNGSFTGGDVVYITFTPIGDKGGTGPQGSQGSIGLQGSQGTQGSLGPTGATGPQGTQGTQGSLGPTGATGAQGTQGTQGSPGTQGSLGPTGSTGPQGTQGSLGPTGATGPMGGALKWSFSGPTGSTAPTSGNLTLNATGFSNTTQININEINFDGATVSTWLSNLTVSSSTNKALLYLTKVSDPTVFAIYTVQSLTDNGAWDQVAVTYLNSNGSFSGGDLVYLTFSITGNQGATGNQGTQGSQGSLGPTGPQGTQGSPGTQGSLGPTGATGAQGTQGSPGTQGTQGSLGPTGATGPQGSQGTQGSLGGTGYVAPRVTATGSTLSPNPNADNTDIFQLTAQAGTAAFTGPAGTPVVGQKMQIEILATGSDRNITWGNNFTAGPIALPTVATLATKLTVGFEYDTSNSLNKWLCIASTVATPGATGPTGPQGSQGSQGSLGVTGATGPTGPTGYVAPRVTATGSTLSPNPNADTTDTFQLTAQAGTAAFTGPAGSPVNSQKMMIEILATGSDRNITWGDNFTAGGVALPSSAKVGVKLTMGFEYDTSNSLNKWLCIATNQTTVGAQGTQGSLGPTGAQGTQGTQGSLGPTGTTGAQGSQGSQGTAGSNMRNPSVNTVSGASGHTPNANTDDVYDAINQATGMTFYASSGTASNGQRLVIRIMYTTTAASYSSTWQDATFGYTARATPTLPTKPSTGGALGGYAQLEFMYNTNNNVNRWFLMDRIS